MKITYTTKILKFDLIASIPQFSLSIFFFLVFPKRSIFSFILIPCFSPKIQCLNFVSNNRDSICNFEFSLEFYWVIRLSNQSSPLLCKATVLLNKNSDMFFFNTIILASIICMCLTLEGLTIFFSILIFKVSALMPCFLI